MSDQLEFNRLTAFDSAGDPVSGAKAYFYQTGTTTPVTVYSDTALSVAHASPLVADSSGVFAPVYYGSATAVKVVVTNASDVTLYTIDPVRKVSGSASAATNITFAPTSEIAETNVQAAIEAVQENATLNFNVISKTANYTVLTTDKSNLIRCTSTLTLSLTAAASLGDGFTFTVEASGATVTIDPNGSETINGASTLTVNDGEFASVFCNGSAFYAAVYPAALSQATWDTGTSTIEAKISPAKLKQAAGLDTETALTTSGASAYGFTGIAASARRITIMFSGVSLSGTDDILIQLGDSGGYENTGYSAASAFVAGSGNDLLTSTAGFPVNTVNSASTVLSGIVTLVRITGNTWVAQGVLHDSNVPGNPTMAGTKTLSAELDRVQVTVTGSNTFDAGTVNIAVEM